MVQPVSQFKSKSGLKRIVAAFSYSMDGFKAAWRNEHAFRQEMLVTVIGTVTALSMKISAFEKLMLVAVLVFVLVVELINSALEAVVDRVSLEPHPLSKNAKDLGSAAVALSIGIALAVWGVVLFNRFY
ncbi:diacylglycerol kinase [Massilia psychrophila]|jgi:diacylglycerol kinase (ATP)|uniref:Diacylglycerol kinase n=1 Tax=Massilia psychrophila TaxID=1603353 RepID=A0A2G8T1U3_9BURK|nr:diacylglycerol kinase [Massilia psychrophila]PIL40006.1 diacylglycerol kinase [Massilia psychrophila]GGE78910.1 diacylglycerol kinase [Massilia psychrophila]